MELSEAKKELEQLSASIGPVDSEYLKEHEPENYKLNQAIDTILKALDNSISKDEIRNKMEKLNKLIKNAEPIEAVFMIKQQQALHELLLGEE